MLTVIPRRDLNRQRLERKKGLNIILYSRSSEALGSMQDMVARLIPKVRIDPYQTVEELSESLRLSAYDSTVVVIIAADRGDLSDLSSLQQLLWGTRTILVLPDADDETVALGHSLRPRFVASREDGLENVVAVLTKMIEDCKLKLNVK
jgi:hypothetical protein